jgi:hypothetical protein
VEVEPESVESESERLRRQDGRAGCITALGLWILIGIPLFLLNLMGECLPRDAPTNAACYDQRHWIGWFSIFGVPIIFGFVGWLVYQWRKRYRYFDES